MSSFKRKINRKKNKKVSLNENKMRRLIRENIIVNEAFETLEDLLAAQTDVEGALETSVKETQAEIQQEMPGMLEKFFNSLGLVDPCDLVRKEPKEVKTQADQLENALDELRVAKAENINAKLGGFANMVGLAGAGSLTYFAFNNKANLGRKGLGVLFDFARNTENDEKNRSIMQKAQQGLPVDQVKDGESYSQAAALQAIDSMDPGEAFRSAAEHMEPKDVNISDADVEAAAGGGDVGSAAARLVNRWSSSGYNPTKDSPQGKRYEPLQVFKGEDGDYYYDEAEADSTIPAGRPTWKRKEKRKSLISDPGMASWRSGKAAKFLPISARAEDKEALENHPDYIDMKAIIAGGDAGKEALKQAMLKKSEAFGSLGYPDPRAYWDGMTDSFKRVSAVTSGNEQSWWQNVTAELKGDKPTDWQKYYNPKGAAWDRYSRNLVTANLDDAVFPDRVPTNANPCERDEVPGEGGKCVPAIKWEKEGWKTAGQVLVIGAAVLHVYRMLLDLAPGPVCTLKNFIGKVMSGIGKFIVSTVGGIVKGIMSAVNFVVDSVKGLFESELKSVDTIVELTKLSEKWRTLDESMNAFSVSLNENLLRESKMKTKIDLNKLSKKVDNKILENAIKSRITKVVQLENAKADWVAKTDLSQFRVMTLSEALLTETAAPEQIAGSKALSAAQAFMAKYQDAHDLFTAMKGAGTNEGEVERVIRKRLDDLDVLYMEYTDLMNNMEKSKGDFKKYLAKGNMAAAMAGVGYGLYAYSQSKSGQEVANKLADTASKASAAITGAFNGVVDKVRGPVDGYDRGDLRAARKGDEEAIANLQATFYEKPEAEQNKEIAEFEAGAKKTADTVTAAAQQVADAFGIDPKQVMANLEKLAATSKEILPADAAAKAEAAAADAPENEDIATPVKLSQEFGKGDGSSLMVGQEKPKSKLSKATDALSQMGQMNQGHDRLEEYADVTAAGMGLVSAFSGENKVAQQVAMAGAAAVGAKYASAAASSWWDSVGLDQDLIEWLEGDGMTDEADLVKKAVDAAGLNVKTASNYDRGY